MHRYTNTEPTAPEMHPLSSCLRFPMCGHAATTITEAVHWLASQTSFQSLPKAGGQRYKRHFRPPRLGGPFCGPSAELQGAPGA